jgi:hypothetical protein
MSKRFSIVESLESRTLMSANPLPADRLAVAAAVLEEASVANANAGTLLTARQAVNQSGVGDNSTEGTLLAKFKSDAAAGALVLQADRDNQASAVAAAKGVVVDQLEVVLADKGTDAEAGAKATLFADRAAVQQAYITGLNQRITDRNTLYNTLFNDQTAIANAEAGAGLTDGQETALNNYTGDKLTAVTNLTATLNGVVTARTQLMTDLNADA